MKSKLFPATIVCIAAKVFAAPAAHAEGISARAGDLLRTMRRWSCRRS